MRVHPTKDGGVELGNRVVVPAVYAAASHTLRVGDFGRELGYPMLQARDLLAQLVRIERAVFV